ncbi:MULTISPECIES: glycosyltransferase [unclassified Dyella]|uniref:glycosyltransferase n=1 Tax=unclassified Dyella TaxID=2634549 RepID=UPI000C84DC3D|nr:MULTISPECIES: glycosyltransferase [unclassified Dyella]MDR3444390.1 glycosyltransferase [Dyella sp.]PMQ06027.1 putative glycosyltransferase YkoT [Dyella sp. AD56]
MRHPKLIVVTPVFEDTEASSILFSELAKSCGREIHVVAVDDGSVREPLTPKGMNDAGIHGTVVRLKRNVGHQRAIAVGLSYVADHFSDIDRVVVMDSDGEDLPETIASLLDELDNSEVDVVVAERRSRVETLRFKAFYVVYKYLFSLLTGRKISFGNFMAMNGAAVRRLSSMGELATHVAGTVLVSRLRWRTCALDRGPRYAGKSKMNFVGLALHGFKGLMIFAEDVLVRVGIACAAVAVLSLLGSSAAVVLKMIGYATPGWFSVVLGLLLLVFLQTGAITLMTLMLTGITRSSTVLPLDYRLLIDQVFATTHDHSDH